MLLSQLLDTKLPDIGEEEGLSTGHTKINGAGPDHLVFWENFVEGFGQFNTMINEKFKERKYKPLIFRPGFEMDVSSHDNLKEKLRELCNLKFSFFEI